MSKIINTYLSLLLLLLSFGLVNAQHEAGYSQYMFNGSIINPAYCGSTGVLNATLSYKNQWTGFGAAPKTLVLGLHSPLKKESSSLGLLILNDRFAITTKSRYALAYAYRLKLNNKLNLRLGLQAGMETIRNDYDKLTLIQSGDASFTNVQPNYLYFTSGAGAYLHSKNFFSGLSMPVIFNSYLQNVSSYKPVYFYSGLKLKLNTNFSLQPSVLVKYIKNSPTQLDVNVLAIYKEKVGMGVSYRTSNTIVANLFYQLNRQFFLGYALEINSGKLARLAMASHEVILKYEFGYAKNLQNPKTFF